MPHPLEYWEICFFNLLVIVILSVLQTNGLIGGYNYCLFPTFEFTCFLDRRHYSVFIIVNLLFDQCYLHICSPNSFLNLQPFYIIKIEI